MCSVNRTEVPADVREAVDWYLRGLDPADIPDDLDQRLLLAGRQAKEVRRLNALYGGRLFRYLQADPPEGRGMTWRTVEAAVDMSSRTMRRWGDDPPF